MFIVFMIVLQQIEGNLIYPRVVGKSVGLPSLWVLFAITVGGSVGGIMGMFLAVPVMSVLYCLIRDSVDSRNARKASVVPYMKGDLFDPPGWLDGTAIEPEPEHQTGPEPETPAEESEPEKPRQQRPRRRGRNRPKRKDSGNGKDNTGR